MRQNSCTGSYKSSQVFLIIWLDKQMGQIKEGSIQSCLSGYRQHGDVCVHQVVRFHYVLRLRGRRLSGDHDHGADVLRQSRCTQEVRGVLRQSERHEVILCITSCLGRFITVESII